MKRREFLGSLVALVVAPFVPTPAPLVLDAYASLPMSTIGMYDGIERSTYSFWRNQGTADLTHLKAEMREIYNRCSNNFP